MVSTDETNYPLLKIKKESSVNIYPHSRESIQCTIMMIFNMAETQWISVPCEEELEPVVVCYKDSNDSNELRNKSIIFSVPSNSSCNSFAFFKAGSCFLPQWLSPKTDSLTLTAKCQDFQMTPLYVGERNLVEFILKTTKLNEFQILYPIPFDTSHIERAIYKGQWMESTFEMDAIKREAAEGFYFCKGEVKINLPSGNVFRCNNGELISSVYVLDGFKDCGEADGEQLSADESFSSFNMIHQHHHCTVPSCRYSPLHYKSNTGLCVSYAHELIKKNRKSEELVVRMFNCSENKSIDFSLVDDLVPDCGSNAEDELLYKDLLQYNHQVKCSIRHELPCRWGHPECYKISDICIYSLSDSKHIIPCRTGSHLEHCEDFDCNIYFKCPGYYCVPWAYVCNGIWDCPYGHDEIANHRCGISRQCTNMFRCKMSQTFIHFREICDGIKNCPLNDDEMLCQLHNYQCLENCICLNLAVSCQGSVFWEHIISDLPYISYHLINVNIYNLMYIKGNVLTKKIHIINGKLTEICSSLSRFNHLLSVDFTSNDIGKLQKPCFNDLNFTYSIIIKNNQLMHIEERTFINISRIVSIDLSVNKLQRIPAFIFVNVFHIGLLNISNNPLTQIDMYMFKSLVIVNILTSVPSVCCVKPRGSMCSALPAKPATCTKLLPQTAMKIILPVLTLMLLVLNAIPCFSFFLQFGMQVKNMEETGTVHKAYHMLVSSVSVGNLIYGIKLVIIWTADCYYAETFFIKESFWQNNNFYLLAYTISMLFNLIVPYFLSLMSLARLMIVLYPLTSQFRTSGFMFKQIFIGFLIAVSMSLVASAVNGLEAGKLAENFCSPFMVLLNRGRQRKTLNLTLLFFQFLCIILNATANLKLLQEINKPSDTVKISDLKKRRQRNLYRKVTVLFGTNCLLWIANTTVYLLGLYISNLSSSVLIWTFILISPLNSIANPLIFIFT